MSKDFEVTDKEELILENYLCDHARKKIDEFCDKDFVKVVLQGAIEQGLEDFFEENYVDIIEKVVEEVKHNLSININIDKGKIKS